MPLAAALTVLATAGCGTKSPAGTSAPAGGDGQAALGHAVTDQVAAERRLKFPNTTRTTNLVGYDDGVGMVRFQLVVWQKGGADNGHYVPDPADPATHRLALSANPAILSAYEICSDHLTLDGDGKAARPCAPQQLIDALHNGKKPYATLRIDGDDHIAQLSELYTP